MLPKIGIFGTGEVVKTLIPILREKGFHVEAIWGQQLKEAQDLAKTLMIPFYTTKIDDVLLRKDVDLIFILTPQNLHSQISVKALGIGKHVVCEKPCGSGVADSKKMVVAAQYYPALISLVNHSLRFLPAFCHMKKAIEDQMIGELSLIDISVKMGSLLHSKYDWSCDVVNGGGCLNLIGSPVIDLITFLTGKRARRVHGIVKTFDLTTQNVNGIRQISAPDFCNFQMELEEGLLVIVNIHSNQSRSAFDQEVTITGTEGRMHVSGGDLICFRKINEYKQEKLYVDVQDLRVSTPETCLPKPYIKGLCKMVSALREAFSVPEQSKTGWIKEPVQSAANFEDGLYVQTVLHAIRQSSNDRCWQKVNMSESPNNNHSQFATAARMSFN